MRSKLPTAEHFYSLFFKHRKEQYSFVPVACERKGCNRNVLERITVIITALFFCKGATLNPNEGLWGSKHCMVFTVFSFIHSSALLVDWLH